MTPETEQCKLLREIRDLLKAAMTTEVRIADVPKAERAGPESDEVTLWGAWHSNAWMLGADGMPRLCSRKYDAQKMCAFGGEARLYGYATIRRASHDA